MKKILILSIAILMLSCNQNKKEIKNDTVVATIKSVEFDWLIGDWERLNEKQGKQTFEHWKKNNEKKYSGFAYTLQGKDTIWQEKMELLSTDGNWKLAVKSPEEKVATIFKMANKSESEFTCENNEIEFPNKIRYWKNGDKLNASVATPEMEIPFEFKRINK